MAGQVNLRPRTVNSSASPRGDSRADFCRCWASAPWWAVGSSAEEDAVGAADTAIISESLRGEPPAAPALPLDASCAWTNGRT